MDYNYTLKYYQEEFDEVVKTYHEIMKGNNAASLILKWAIENNIADNIFCNLSADLSFYWIEGLKTIYEKLYWCLYNNGCVIFLKTDGTYSWYIFFDDGCNYSETLPETVHIPFGVKHTAKVIDATYSPFEFMDKWEESIFNLKNRRTNWKNAKDYEIPDW